MSGGTGKKDASAKEVAASAGSAQRVAESAITRSYSWRSKGVSRERAPRYTVRAGRKGAVATRRAPRRCCADERPRPRRHGARRAGAGLLPLLARAVEGHALGRHVRRDQPRGSRGAGRAQLPVGGGARRRRAVRGARLRQRRALRRWAKRRRARSASPSRTPAPRGRRG